VLFEQDSAESKEGGAEKRTCVAVSCWPRVRGPPCRHWKLVKSPPYEDQGKRASVRMAITVWDHFHSLS